MDPKLRLETDLPLRALTLKTYDWKDSQWTVPINATLSQLLKIGGQPLQLQLGYRYYAEAPTNGPDWGIRFQVSFLFPEK